MGNQGWAKLNNAGYKRVCPGLCPTCVHLNPNKVRDWLYCDALHKLLSNPHTTPGKCDSYKAGEKKLSDDMIQTLQNDAIEFQQERKARKAKRNKLFG